jgi:hypothetical protein
MNCGCAAPLGGPFKPTLDVCCGNCEGHTFVRAAHKAHEDLTGEHVYFVTLSPSS